MEAAVLALHRCEQPLSHRGRSRATCTLSKGSRTEAREHPPEGLAATMEPQMLSLDTPRNLDGEYLTEKRDSRTSPFRSAQHLRSTQ